MTTLNDAYAYLLEHLARRNFNRVSPELRENILHFYADSSAPMEIKKDTARWQTVLVALEQLKQATPVVAGSLQKLR